MPLTFVQVQSSISDSILDALYRNRSDVEIAKSKKKRAYFLHDWGTSARALVNHLYGSLLITVNNNPPRNITTKLTIKLALP